jgi:hypothetical protein
MTLFLGPVFFSIRLSLVLRQYHPDFVTMALKSDIVKLSALLFGSGLL